MNFDAFGAFCPDALVHFGSGIQVQEEGGWGFPATRLLGQSPSFVSRDFGRGKGISSRKSHSLTHSKITLPSMKLQETTVCPTEV